MGVYIPLKVRLAKASIPQVVAYIQTYLEDNPIPAMDTFAELIAEFLEDHPELVAVASVNAKTGAVILTGADIMLNSTADVTLDTEVTNLNSMIASLSSQVAQAVTTVGGFETDIEDINADIDTINVALDTKDTEIYQINQTLTSHLNGINTNTTKNAQQDTRLTALETALDDLETDIDDLQTLTELHTQQIRELSRVIDNPQEIDARLTAIENDVDAIETSVTTINGNITNLQNSVSASNTRLNSAESNITSLGTRMNSAESNITSLDTRVTALESSPSTGGLVISYKDYTVQTIAPDSQEAVNINFSSSVSWSSIMVYALAQNTYCFTNVVPINNTTAGIAIRNFGTVYANNVMVRVYVVASTEINFTLS